MMEYLELENGKKVELKYAKKCCLAIDKIQRIIQDNSLDDKECFWRIEEIVLTFELLDIDAGTRHDF